MTPDPTTAADVCLVLEGTYPYVQGGVSSWVHELIRGLPEVRFGLVHIAPTRGAYRGIRYVLPPNVVFLRELYCRDPRTTDAPSAPHRSASRVLGGLRRLVGETTVHDSLLDDLGSRDLSVSDVRSGAAALEVIKQLYRDLAPSASFVDFFWHVRSMWLPLIQLLAAPAPNATRFHSLCTGYAGLLAAVWSQQTRRPLLLTEHGIYVRERSLDLFRASRGTSGGRDLDAATTSAIHSIWMRYFAVLARCTYERAEVVVSLSNGHRDRQIADGAAPERSFVVANGVNVEALTLTARLVPRTARSGPVRIGFVGRLVPIKDVVTFLRACAIAATSVEIDVRIFGPADEDSDYARRCHRLVADLGLEAIVRFEGSCSPSRIYSELDVIVLTSFSEGQPLVILEASAAGLPVIASDVGACREMLTGGSDLDRHLGPSGLVTRLADPDQTARAIVQLASDQALRARMGAVGQRRVRTYYQQSSTVDAYRSLYGGEQWQGSAGASSA